MGTGNTNNITELAKYKNWIVRDSNKIPYSVFTGKGTKPQAQNEWCNLATALATVKKYPNKYAGIGFELSYSPFTVIDLDHCVNDDGTLTDFSRRVVTMFQSYTEFSPSLKGLHIWCMGKTTPSSIKHIDNPKTGDTIEIYSENRYITVTGKAFNNYPITSQQEMLDQYIESILAIREQRKNHARQQVITSNSGCDDVDTIVSKIRDSKQGSLFSELYDNGDLSRYSNDDSRADMALLSILAFWCKRNASMMETIFSQSALGKRDKWIKRADYRQRTIDNAIAGCNDVYETPPKSKLIDLSIYIRSKRGTKNVQ